MSRDCVTNLVCQDRLIGRSMKGSPDASLRRSWSFCLVTHENKGRRSRVLPSERASWASRTLCSLSDRGASRDRILCSGSGNLTCGPTDPDFPIRNPQIQGSDSVFQLGNDSFLEPVICVPREETDGGALQALIALSEFAGDLPQAVRELGFSFGNLSQGPRELGCFYGALSRGAQ